MSVPFTNTRKEILDRMKGDSRFGDVAHWYEFGSGIRERFETQPSDCPYIAVFPQESGEDEPANVMRSIPQGLTVEIGTAGQDVEPIEELLWGFLMWLEEDPRQDNLGMASDGLATIAIDSIDWGLFPSETAPAPMWVVSISLRLVWNVTT